MICKACGTENRAGRKFCSQCGAALALACPACGTTNEPGDRFCAECGAALGAEAPASGTVSTNGTATATATAPAATATAPPAPAPAAPAQPGQYADEAHVEERRIATILFADLAGFTAMSEGLDAEDVKALASHCAQVMSAEVKRFGGTVTGIMGDAIMGAFGAPIAHEDDPERAIRAALAMREQIRAQDLGPKKLDLHVGVNTGETMAGLIGPAGRQDYTAMGDTTNTAARLMSHAPTGSIYVGEQTYLATRQSVLYREAEAIEAKGKSQPVRAWEVLEAPPIPEPRPLGTAPFVGRRQELASLVELWSRVRQEHCACSFTLVGPAGIGKTRLLREATSVLEGKPEVLWGRCLAYGEGITYWPVIEMVSSAAGISHGDDVPAKLEKLGRFVESLPTDDSDQLQSIATALSNLLALPTTPRGTFLTSRISQGELHWGIRRTFELLAAHSYLVIVFEDLHWSEPTLFELFQYLCVAPAPLLVLASARPEGLDDRPALPADERHGVARLPGLTTEEASVVLEQLLEGFGQTERLQPLLRAAGGNPLFLEETIRMLSSAGALTPDAISQGLLEEMPIPSSVQGLIGSRLDMLPTDEKRMAQHGSVVGQVFWSGAVAHIGHWRDPVEPELQDLVAREVVEWHKQSELADEREFAFRHILIRDVAYGRLPRGERALLHAACADWFTQQPGRREELIEIIAYHLEQSCKLAPTVGARAALRPLGEAVEALSAAAQRAEMRDGAREAQRFYTRALELRGLEPQVSCELRIKRARSRVMLGELSKAAADLEEAEIEARALGRNDLRGLALVTLANIYLKQGRASDAGRAISEAEAMARELDDRWLQVRAMYEQSALLGDFAGDAEGAISVLRTAVDIAEQLEDLQLRLEGHLRIGILLVNLGRLTEAELESTFTTKLAGPLGSNRDKARATYLLALVSFYRSGPEAARAIAEQALTWQERVGDNYFQLQSLRVLAKCDLIGGHPDRAEQHLLRALPLAEASGGWLLVETCRYLAEALLDLGRIPEAAEAAGNARKALPPEDDYATGAVLLAEAIVSASGTDPAGAWNGFAESMRILEEQQLWLDLGEARILHARALARDGLRAQARDALEQARALFTDLEAGAMVEYVERDLARL